MAQPKMPIKSEEVGEKDRAGNQLKEGKQAGNPPPCLSLSNCPHKNDCEGKQVPPGAGRRLQSLRLPRLAWFRPPSALTAVQLSGPGSDELSLF